MVNVELRLFYSELIIRCVDRQLETMTMLDMDSLELFLQNHIVQLWTQTGWMTAKYDDSDDRSPMTLSLRSVEKSSLK